jgi:hypothetical protein
MGGVLCASAVMGKNLLNVAKRGVMPGGALQAAPVAT